MYTADAGRVELDEREITGAAPKDRPISMVYQDYMLFPHLTVEENIRFGRIQGVSEAEIDGRVDRFTDLLDIDDLRHRYPRTLSGGEKQRVALARSLVLDPEVLLLDEPVSALDVPSKEQIIDELESIQAETDVTVLHVTHGREEAIRLADRLAVMKDGEIVQTGTTETVFEEPNSRFVAQFVGTENVFEGTATWDGDSTSVELESGLEIEASDRAEGETLACIRPEYVSVRADQPTDGQWIDGELVGVSRREAAVQLDVEAGVEITARLTTSAYAALDAAVGDTVFVGVDPESIHLIANPGR
ncbi:ABC transporter ATP-binding protein [Halanaeroarchaeum sp. HSR-CO]|uniref:ABC transporter ATP-binding protein n=1 Tax=Halanaeroarchaeum sp. HSR-CO TaxID=2866382 RepID=UPI00217DF68E|nr:ABC transporter ATP-binding protein [Halanaeroarchaeum sp. HSR-CO]